MNYNPQNQEGLLGLVAALKNGMDPNTAYSLYQGIQQDQAAQIAQRQQRLQGIADLLTNAAVGGMPYSGAQALAEAQPGPAGPAVQSMLSSLYPNSGTSGPDLNYLGNPMDQPAGNAPTPTGFTPPLGPSQMQYPVPSTTTSPAYQPPPPDQAQVQAQQLQALMAELTQNAQALKQQGMTRDQFIQEAAKAYPELFAANIDAVQQIILTIFGNETPA